jgi:hypothetical protein
MEPRHYCRGNHIYLGRLSVVLKENQKEPKSLYDLLDIDEKYRKFVELIEPYFIGSLEHKAVYGLMLLNSNFTVEKCTDDFIEIRPLTDKEESYRKCMCIAMKGIKQIQTCIKCNFCPAATYSRYIQYLYKSNIKPRYNIKSSDDYIDNDQTFIISPDRKLIWFLGHVNQNDIYTDMISTLYFYNSDSIFSVDLGKEKLSNFVTELITYSTPESLLTKDSKIIKRTIKSVCSVCAPIFKEKEKEDLKNECNKEYY